MKRSRLFLRLGLFAVLVAALVVVYFQYRMKNPPTPRLPGAEVILEIPPGTSTSEIFRRLDREGVVEDGRLAEVYYRLHRRKTALQAGEYRFRRPMPIDDVINMMGRGDVVRHAIVVPEGLTAQETFEQFWKQGIGGPEAFKAALVQTELVPGLTNGVTDLEGFLFPDTYVVTRSTSAAQIVDRMTTNFREHFTPDLQRRASALGLTTRQAVTLASIIQKESSIKAEGPLIASVYWNRLHRGMRLQADPTVIYALKRDGRWRGTLLRSDYDYESPYNTYVIGGLPPGPIANPGADALRAAVNPAKTNYLYFVADPTTLGHTFSTNFEDHLLAIALARKARGETPAPYGPEMPEPPITPPAATDTPQPTTGGG
ncbi:MAG TPA: endolytic transglycosylase MltG [Thermoanaerobaculia bacterium]